MVQKEIWMKDNLVSQDETTEDMNIRKAREAGIKAFMALNEDDFAEGIISAFESGKVLVEPLVDLKSITDEFGIVGSHERGCGCTSEKRNPECFPTRNLA